MEKRSTPGIQCTVCNELIAITNFAQHNRLHLQKIVQSYREKRCCICGIIVNDRLVLQKHLVEQHPNYFRQQIGTGRSRQPIPIVLEIESINSVKKYKADMPYFSCTSDNDLQEFFRRIKP